MGNEKTGEPIISEKEKLIDFLYIDQEKIDSFLSQIQKGALRSVKKTNGVTQGSSISGEASIPQLAKGTVVNNNQDKDDLEQQFDPYHSQILELIEHFNLPVLEELPDFSNGDILLLESAISIRNLDTIRQMLPLAKKHKKVMGLQQANFKSTEAIFSFVEDILGIMPLSIDAEITLKSGQIVHGPLKESNLSIKTHDLFRAYGTQLPGNWFVLGMIDRKEEVIAQPSQQNDLTLYQFVDQISSGMATFCSSGSVQVTPILIFRTVSY